MKYDSVIIGSGVSGLTSALVLAKHGQKVAVLEKSSHAGPLLRRFKRGKVWCDPGLHYTGGLGPSGPLSVLLRYLGIRDRIQALPMDPDAFDILYFNGREIPLPCGMERVEDALCSHFPESREAVRSYIREIKSLTRATPFVNFDMPYDEIGRIPYETETLSGFLQQAGAPAELRDLLGQYGQGLYGVPKDEVPFSVHALVMGFFYHSAHTLARGGDEIIDAFEQRLAEEGVDLFCGSPATGLKVDAHRRLQGIETGNGEFLECENSICTIHPALLMDILPPEAVRPAYLSRLRGLENTNPPFALFLEMDPPPKRIAHTNLYTFNGRRTGPDPDTSFAIMACNPEEHDNKKKGMCILRESPFEPVPKEAYTSPERSQKYLEYKEAETERTIQQVLDFLPEIKGKFKVVNSATPFTYNRYTGTPGGSMYGVKHSVNQIKLNPVTAIKGFYLAGQSILMPGVMGAAISGFLGAAYSIGLKTLWNEIRQWR